jgi:hypothetical protein
MHNNDTIGKRVPTQQKNNKAKRTKQKKLASACNAAQVYRQQAVSGKRDYIQPSQG